MPYLGANHVATDASRKPWWLAPASALAPAGLSGKEAKARLASNGPNQLGEHRQKSLALQYLSRFRNPLVLILLAASAVSAFSQEVTNFLIIIAIVLLSVTLDFVQEYRASTAAEKLRLRVSLQASVLRDGKAVTVPASEVVLGDVVLLAAGDLIPADGRVIEALDFFVKQALLTGEPYPVEKRPGVLPDAATELQDATNAVFMGTSVVSGSARMDVMATGADTAIGEIADTLARPACADSACSSCG
jgi:Mg2+-importing ATPase